MALFNTKATRLQRYKTHPAKTTSHEGGDLYTSTPEMELYLQACTMMFNDKFYESKSEARQRLVRLINQCDRTYVLKLAAYVRNEMKLRSVPQMLLAEASVMVRNSPGEPKPDVRAYTPRIVKRADEMGEVLSYWINVIGNGSKSKLPNALRKGLADVFGTFDEYQLDKYNRKSASVKLVDVLRLVHPKPSSKERSALYRRLRDGELNPGTLTHEKVLSAAGQSGKSKKDAWNDIASSMGTMALLKNVRNMHEAGADKALDIAKENFISNNASNRMLPIRWYQAYMHAPDSSVKDAIAVGLENSLKNLPVLNGKIAMVVDTSNSMTWHEYRHNGQLPIQTAALLSAIGIGMCKPGSTYTSGQFATSYGESSVSSRDSVITNMEKTLSSVGKCGGGTDPSTILNNWIARKKVVDHFFLFSDMQIVQRAHGFAALWDEYRCKINPKAKMYTFDLNGYGKGGLVPDHEKGCYQFAGFSERVFDFVSILDRGEDMTSIINNY